MHNLLTYKQQVFQDLDPDTMEVNYFSIVEHELINRAESPCQVSKLTIN